MTTIFSLICIVVGVTPSIIIVSGQLASLNSYRDDVADVYALSNCRYGRCAGLTYSSPVGRDHNRRLYAVDTSAKSFGGDDYNDNDDKAVGRTRQLEEDRRMMTFPYCLTTSVDECRSLLRRLERLRLRAREVSKRNVVVTRVDGAALVRLLGRRRRRSTDTRGGNQRTSGEATTKTRAVRSGNANAAFEANRLLDEYRAWRKENGYGRNYARWGRASATENAEDGAAHHHGGTDVSSEKTTNNNSTNAVHRRTPRSVVVEIEPEEELPANERDMLDTYLAWREINGYGTLAGRWG